MKIPSFVIVFLAACTLGFLISTKVILAQGSIFEPNSYVGLFNPGLIVVGGEEELHLTNVLINQDLISIWPFNPIKFALRQAIASGIPTGTTVLLLLLPVVAAVIAAARHLIGLRGFGIFLPAALSIVFLAIGPVLGIGLFLVIVAVSAVSRAIFKVTKIKLQYLPRMAFLLWFVVLAVLAILFAGSYLGSTSVSSVSIFPVLFLVLLAEDFTRVQLGKSVRTAVNLTTETLILALVSYIFLVLRPLQEFSLLQPEMLLLGTAIFDLVLGKYIGLRLLEYWRFRKLITSGQ